MGLLEIQDRIAIACNAAGRDPEDITLIAVSKVQPLERVEAVLEAGHRTFGENRVQEAEERWGDLQTRYDNLELHLIGPLQTNKVRPALRLFASIHSVDRPKLARAIARIAEEEGHTPEIFVQVNTGDEAQKAGVALDDADELIALCRDLGLNLVGLMCIPPVDEPPSLHFALLKKIADRNGLMDLSMGMSSDFEEAIAQGATHIRVGSAIFGARDYG